jgi:hypothetical protein
MQVTHHLHLVKNEWCCTSSPLKHFYGMHGGTLTLYLSRLPFTPLHGLFLGAAPGDCFISIHFCSSDILGNGLDVSQKDDLKQAPY